MLISLYLSSYYPKANGKIMLLGHLIVT
ncbi:hypothetical protein M6B38_256270 [Iris pallida]|uniref:Uncharacterized protein n=1 Tax=Iris pallida TaxID=29817 RepID=A0AAX6IHY8_IRIPA|nr:hypothetical protein M6B38_256270 [Iris pallida]